MSEILEKMKTVILSQTKIAIISHSNPDGDTLGSQLALANAVSQFGIETRLINGDKVSEKYAFLSKWEALHPLQEDEELPEVVVFVDCANLERAGMLEQQERFVNSTILNIDHHPSNTNFGSLNYVVSTAAANCQVIYELLMAMGAEVTPEIATALYLGLSTDTGSFLFESVSADTHRLAAILIEAQADTDSVRKNMYESCSVAKFELQKHIYSHTEVSAEGKLAWSSLSQEILERTHADSADIDGLINSIKNIDGVEIAVLFREIGYMQIKVSFRSKEWADVNALAGSFNGGGHIRAAGCTIQGMMGDVQQKVLAAAEALLNKEV